MTIYGDDTWRREGFLGLIYSMCYEHFWKLVKGELRQQLMSYAEGFNLDLMHQGDQKVQQHTNANTVT